MKRFRAGFTLVELSLSMVFIGILSVSVVLIINNTVAAYRRGMTLNHINTVGMDLVDELRSAVQGASSRSIAADCAVYYRDNATTQKACEDDGGFKFVTVKRCANVDLDSTDGSTDDVKSDMPAWGAFCTGTYSYIWNTGYYVNTSDTHREVSKSWATLTYNYNGDTKTIFGEKNGEFVYTASAVDAKTQPFRLLKVYDDKRSVCVSTVRPYESGKYDEDYANTTVENFDGNFNISVGYPVLTEEPAEMILADEYNDLVIYDLAVERPVESSTQKNSFYSASFILGTIRGGVDITAKGKSCEPPEDYDNGNFDYCAINKFNFAVQAGGE